MTRFISVCSAKGGVGKTVISLNLATALVQKGNDVTVVDTNLTSPNVGVHLGSTNLPSSLHDVMKGRRSLIESTYVHPSGLKIVPSSLFMDDLRDLNLKKLSDVMLSLEGSSDFVILDSPSGLGEEAVHSMRTSDELLVVTEPTMPSVVSALRTIKMAEEHGIGISGVILNKVGMHKNEMVMTDIEKVLSYPVISSIPYDKNVHESIRLNHPLVYINPGSPASSEFIRLASGILGERLEQGFKKESRINSYISKLLGL